MAAPASQPDLIKITINGVDVEVPKGELLVESVKRLGLEIPIFCYHPRMKPVGMCRMCLVELGFKQPDGSVRMMPKPQAGCTLPAMENMVVVTDSEAIAKDRKGVLEFLLVNHPLDCPICDRGGECPLQNNTIFYGPSTSRYSEVKRHLPKAFPLSSHVTLDLERCIQCGRCVRFTEEISGDSQLAFLFRGAAMTPSTFKLTDFDSKFSGNVIEICPVGALTSSQYRFRARPWDLQSNPSVCLECGNGCNVWFDHRAGKMVRINGRSNDAVNEEWTCDRGKFGHDYLNSSARLKSPRMRKDDLMVETGWADAYSEILERFDDGRTAVAGLVGERLSNEDLFLFRRMFHRVFHSPNLDYRWFRSLPSQSESVRGRHGIDEVHQRFSDLENVSRAFVFGGDLGDDAPMAYLRLRKAMERNGAAIVVASDRPTFADRIAAIALHFNHGTEASFLAGLTKAISEKRGGGELGQAVANVNVAACCSACGVSESDVRSAAEILSGEFTTVCSNALYSQNGGVSVVSQLANLAIATGNSPRFNMYSSSASDEGASMLGVHPGGQGMNTKQILEGCADGRIKALWLVNADPFTMWHDRDLVSKALETVDFLVVQSITDCEAASYASVILPCAAHTETDGSYTNSERRVQRIEKIVQAPGHAKPSWKIFSELMLRKDSQAPPFSAGEVMDRLSAEEAEFEGVIYSKLGGEGFELAVGIDKEPQLDLSVYSEVKT